VIEVIDNFLPEEYFNSLTLMVEDLPWFYNNYSVYKGDNDSQFYHLLYFNNEIRSQYYKYVHDVYDQYIPNAKDHTLYRMKINATPRTDSIRQKQFHVDLKDKHRVCILYLNSNDGYTVFEDKTRKVESVANRAVLFPGECSHTGSSCTDEGLRIVLNIDYLI